MSIRAGELIGAGTKRAYGKIVAMVCSRKNPMATILNLVVALALASVLFAGFTLA